VKDPGSIRGIKADFWHVLSTDNASMSRLVLKLLLESVSACVWDAFIFEMWNRWDVCYCAVQHTQRHHMLI
jgi:hypothetical protein